MLYQYVLGHSSTTDEVDERIVEWQEVALPIEILFDGIKRDVHNRFRNRIEHKIEATVVGTLRHTWRSVSAPEEDPTCYVMRPRTRKIRPSECLYLTNSSP